MLAAGAAPNLLKLNRLEAGRLLGRELRGDDEVMQAARTLRSWGIEHVVITRGSRGCVAATEAGEFRVPAVEVEVNSSVGAGDAFLAGLLLALVRERGWVEALRLATAAGAATCHAPGTELCSAAEVERALPRVRVEAVREAARVR